MFGCILGLVCSRQGPRSVMSARRNPDMPHTLCADRKSRIFAYREGRLRRKRESVACGASRLWINKCRLENRCKGWRVVPHVLCNRLATTCHVSSIPRPVFHVSPFQHWLWCREYVVGTGSDILRSRVPQDFTNFYPYG